MTRKFQLYSCNFNSDMKRTISLLAILCFTICSFLVSCSDDDTNDTPVIEACEYTTIEFDEASIAMLKEYAQAHNPWNASDSITYSCDHMTVYHWKEVDNVGSWDWSVKHNGKTFEMTATTVGFSDHCFAMEIATDIPVITGVPHTTLIVNKTNGGQAWESRLIENWKPLEKEIKLRGVVTFHMKK